MTINPRSLQQNTTPVTSTSSKPFDLDYVDNFDAKKKMTARDEKRISTKEEVALALVDW